MRIMSSSVPAAQTPRLSAAVALRVFVPFAAGYFLSYIFRTVNSVIAPNLVADTGLDAADLGLLTSAFFLAFALAQLPLGLFLDRFGPRRVEMMLLAFAAAGCLLFAWGEGLAGLSVGRALIGLGVSACMMASFKAFVMWFAPQRLPMVNGCLLAVGATGALAATAPVEWILGFTDWRALFWGLAAFTGVIALTVYGVVPEHPEPPLHVGLRSQLRGLRSIFRDPFFWRVTPLSMLSQAAFLAVQGLWAGPWLRDVAGLGRMAVANQLLAMSAAIVAGFMGWGLLADRLSRRGVRPLTLAGAGMSGFLVVQWLLVWGPSGWALPLWVGFGLLGTSGTLPYAVLSQAFHGQLAGRVNTALNLMVFIAAFATQWGMGAVIHWWEDPVTHTYATTGYRVSFGVLAVMQVLALAWFLLPGGSARRRGVTDVSDLA